MGFVVSPSSGLLLPQGSEEAAVSAALKAHDPELRLVPQDSDHYGRRIYKVYRWNGPDREATFVCGWWDDDLKPLPLSSGLVEYVKYLDRNTVGRAPDADELTAKLREERRKDYMRDAEAIVQEFGRKIDGKSFTPMPRSRSLQLSRQRERDLSRRAGTPEEYLP
jgi:hypothetical protein